MKHTLITATLLLTVSIGMAQSKHKKEPSEPLLNWHIDTADLRAISGTSSAPGNWTFHGITNPKPVIIFEQPDTAGNYIIHFRRQNLIWVNDSTAVYVTKIKK